MVAIRVQLEHGIRLIGDVERQPARRLPGGNRFDKRARREYAVACGADSLSNDPRPLRAGDTPTKIPLLRLRQVWQPPCVVGMPCAVNSLGRNPRQVNDGASKFWGSRRNEFAAGHPPKECESGCQVDCRLATGRRLTERRVTFRFESRVVNKKRDGSTCWPEQRRKSGSR